MASRFCTFTAALFALLALTAPACTWGNRRVAGAG
jgi:hypothetical protein